MNNTDSLRRKLQIKYFLRFLDILPQSLSSQETTRIVLAFFSLSGLDILNHIETLSDDYKKNIITWIYRLQTCDDEELVCGFQGSTFINTVANRDLPAPYKWGHLASTYSALCCLIILGDDLSRVHRKGIIKSVRALQEPNGCFTAAKEGNESDMRFVYCAACICYILDDWSGMDIEKTIDYILNSISYDGAIGQGPELESHGGTTFCAIATLTLLNRLDVLTTTQISNLKRWLVLRQTDGFQGRPNKPTDTCYSFWIGATLKLLGALDLIDFDKNQEYIMSTQDIIVGGFSKWVSTRSDPLHTYLGLGGLSLMKKENLCPIVPTLNITERAYEHLKTIHKKWKAEL